MTRLQSVATEPKVGESRVSDPPMLFFLPTTFATKSSLFSRPDSPQDDVVGLRQKCYLDDLVFVQTKLEHPIHLHIFFQRFNPVFQLDEPNLIQKCAEKSLEEPKESLFKFLKIIHENFYPPIRHILYHILAVNANGCG